MKTNKFVLWQIKKWLPLFIVTALIVLVFLRSNIVLIDSSTMSVFSFIAFITPLFVFGERFDKGAADAYRAFPANKLQIKRIKVLIMLGYLVALITVTYFAGVIFYIVSHGSSEAAQYQQFYEYDPFGMIKAGGGSFFVSYLLLIVYTVSTYLFNCTLASLGNFLLSSIIYISAGTLLLTATVPAFILTFATKNGLKTYLIDCLSNLDFLGVGGTYGKQFGIQMILGKMYELPAFVNTSLSTATIVILSILFVIELAVGVLCFFLKDPSGEHYSMPGARDERHKIVIYASYVVTFMIIAFLSALMGSALPELFNVYVIVLFILTAISTYISMVVFNKRFALNKKELIVLASIIGFGLIVTLVSYFRISAMIEGQNFYGI